MADKNEKLESCIHCENYIYCGARMAADECMVKVYSTGLFSGNSVSAKDLYKLFVEKGCRKQQKIEME